MKAFISVLLAALLLAPLSGVAKDDLGELPPGEGSSTVYILPSGAALAQAAELANRTAQSANQASASTQDFQQDSKVFVFGHEEWLKCQRDDQCTIIHTARCGFAVAINKDHSNQPSDFGSAVQCTQAPLYPSNRTAKCVSNECVLVGSWPQK